MHVTDKCQIQKRRYKSIILNEFQQVWQQNCNKSYTEKKSDKLSNMDYNQVADHMKYTKILQ